MPKLQSRHFLLCSDVSRQVNRNISSTKRIDDVTVQINEFNSFLAHIVLFSFFLLFSFFVVLAFSLFVVLAFSLFVVLAFSLFVVLAFSLFVVLAFPCFLEFRIS